MTTTARAAVTMARWPARIMWDKDADRFQTEQFSFLPRGTDLLLCGLSRPHLRDDALHPHGHEVAAQGVEGGTGVRSECQRQVEPVRGARHAARSHPAFHQLFRPQAERAAHAVSLRPVRGSTDGLRDRRVVEPRPLPLFDVVRRRAHLLRTDAGVPHGEVAALVRARVRSRHAARRMDRFFAELQRPARDVAQGHPRQGVVPDGGRRS